MTFILDKELLKKLEVLRAKRTRQTGDKQSLSEIINELLDKSL